VARPSRLSEAIASLQAILPCSGAYFGLVESFAESDHAAGAAPHRDQHRRSWLKFSERSIGARARAPSQPLPTSAHALDALVLHEAPSAARSRRPGLTAGPPTVVFQTRGARARAPRAGTRPPPAPLQVPTPVHKPAAVAQSGARQASIRAKATTRKFQDLVPAPRPPPSTSSCAVFPTRLGIVDTQM